MSRDNFNIKKQVYRKLTKEKLKLNDSLTNHPLFDEITNQEKYFFINQNCSCDFRVINNGYGLEIYGAINKNTLNLKKNFTSYKIVQLTINPETKDFIYKNSYGELLDYDSVIKVKKLSNTLKEKKESKTKYSIFNSRYVCSLSDDFGIELRRCEYREDSRVFESAFDNLELLIDEVNNSKPIVKNKKIRPYINEGGFRYKIYSRDANNLNLIKRERKKCNLINNIAFEKSSETTYHINAFYNPRKIELRNPDSYFAKEEDNTLFDVNDNIITLKSLEQEVAEDFVNRKDIFIDKKDQVLVPYVERTKQKYNIKIYKHKAIKKER